MISHKYKCIFIEIPKNASSSITKWLYKNDESTLSSQSEINRWARQKKHRHRDGHVHTTELRHFYRKYWDDYYKFAVIRNPFDRVFSCYSMYTSKEWESLYRENRFSIHDRRLYEEVSEYKNFPEFCSGYLDRITIHSIFQNGERYSEEGMYHGVHLREQSYWVNPTKEWSDNINIIKYENLEDEIQSLSDALGIPFSRKDFPWINKNGKGKGSYKGLYDAESIKIVKKKYRSDFYFFKYNF